MATVTKLMFDIESKYNGIGLTQARKDLQRFSQQLSQLEKKRVRANVELNINRNTVDKKIREVEATKPKVMVELDVDVDAFNAKMRTLQGGRVTVQVDPDMAEFERRLAQARGGRATINADADTRVAEEQIDRAARDRNSFIHVHADNNTLNHTENNMKRLGMAARVAALGVAALMAAFYLLGPAMALVGAAATVMLPAAFGMMAAVALAKNEEVKASFENLGNTFKGIMTEGADSVKNDILGVSAFLQTELVRIAPQLKAAFGAAGDLFLPLTQGVMNLATGALPGMTLAMQQSGPIMDGFKAGMNSLGIGLGSMFNRMTEGAVGLGNVWRVMGDGLGNTLEIIGTGAGKMAQTGSVSLRKMLDGINGLIGGMVDGAIPAMEAMAGGSSVWFSIFNGIGTIFREAGPAIGQFTTALSDALGPAIDRLAPALGQLLSGTLMAFVPVLNQMAPALLVLANALASVMEWAAQHPIIMQLFAGFMLGVKLVGPLMGLIGIFKGIGSGIMAVAGAIKFLAPVFGILKIAIMGLFSMIMAHPVVAAIVAIVAVIALLVMNWDKVWPHIKATWELLWNYVKTSAEMIWNGLKAAWEFLCGAFRQVWDFFVALFKPGWDALWNGVKFVAQAVWDFLKAAWNGLVTGIKAIWEFVSNAVSASWNQTWETIKNVAVGIWNFLKATWEFILNAIKAYWDFWSGAISAAWNAVWNWIKDVASGIWNWIKDRWNDFLNGVKIAWEFYSGIVKNAWNAVWNWIKDVAKGIWDWIKDRWNDFCNGIKVILERFRDLVQGIWQRFWDTIRNAAQWVWDRITEGFNRFKDGVVGIFEGLINKARDVWNGVKRIFAEPINWVIGVWNDHVADKIGLGDKKIPKIEGYADGGQIPGNGYGRADDRLAWVSSGEFVVQERYARENMPLLTAINGGQKFNQGVGIPMRDNAFADGGMVGNIEAAHDAARRVGDGRGYVYGGSGPDGFDCSGYMSWIYNALVGEPNLSQRRFSTESDFHALGFKDGLGAGFSIGIHNGGGGPNSHMAGTLTLPDGSGGVNVESGGAHNSTAYGGPAQGADSFHRTMTFVGDGDGGGLGKFLAGAVGGLLGKAVASIFQTVWKPMTDPILAGIPSPFLPGMGEQFGGIPKGFATKIRDDVGELIKQKEPKGNSFVAGGAVPDGERRRIISEALRLNGMDPNDEAWLRGMNTLIQRESSWNPNSINTWDSNAEKGTPSKGLAQMIDPTFQAYKIPGRENIMDPVDNVAASINYIRKHHGGIGNVQQANENAGPLGYRDGTENSRAGWNLVGENGPEMMKMKGGSAVHSFDDIIGRMNAVDPQRRMIEAFGEFGKSTFDTFWQDATGGSLGGVAGAILNDVVPYVAGFDANRKKMFEEAQNQQPGNVDPNVQNMQTTGDPSSSGAAQGWTNQMEQENAIARRDGKPEPHSAADLEAARRGGSSGVSAEGMTSTKIGHQGDVTNNYYVSDASEAVRIEKEKQRLEALGYADI